MYNPYNWKINKIDKSWKMKKFDDRILPDNRSKCICVLDELTYICSKLDSVRLKHKMLDSELSAVNDELMDLERKKISLIEELARHP